MSAPRTPGDVPIGDQVIFGELSDSVGNTFWVTAIDPSTGDARGVFKPGRGFTMAPREARFNLGELAARPINEDQAPGGYMTAREGWQPKPARDVMELAEWRSLVAPAWVKDGHASARGHHLIDGDADVVLQAPTEGSQETVPYAERLAWAHFSQGDVHWWVTEVDYDTGDARGVVSLKGGADPSFSNFTLPGLIDRGTDTGLGSGPLVQRDMRFSPRTLRSIPQFSQWLEELPPPEQTAAGEVAATIEYTREAFEALSPDSRTGTVADQPRALQWVDGVGTTLAPVTIIPSTDVDAAEAADRDTGRESTRSGDPTSGHTKPSEPSETTPTWQHDPHASDRTTPFFPDTFDDVPELGTQDHLPAGDQIVALRYVSNDRYYWVTGLDTATGEATALVETHYEGVAFQRINLGDLASRPPLNAEAQTHTRYASRIVAEPQRLDTSSSFRAWPGIDFPTAGLAPDVDQGATPHPDFKAGVLNDELIDAPPPGRQSETPLGHRTVYGHYTHDASRNPTHWWVTGLDVTTGDAEGIVLRPGGEPTFETFNLLDVVNTPAPAGTWRRELSPLLDQWFTPVDVGSIADLDVGATILDIEGDGKAQAPNFTRPAAARQTPAPTSPETLTLDFSAPSATPAATTSAPLTDTGHAPDGPDVDGDLVSAPVTAEAPIQAPIDEDSSSIDAIGEDADRSAGAVATGAKAEPAFERPADRALTAQRAVEDNLEVLRGLRDGTADQELMQRWHGWGAAPQIFAHPDWGEQRAELEDLVGAEGMKSAERTTLNAHYTDPRIAQAMWDAVPVSHHGPTLEPGVGRGVFPALAPDGATVLGVELDETTANVARARFAGRHEIVHQSFAEIPIDDGQAVAAIGNVPFGSYRLYDPQDNPGRRLSIHDHFIAKSARALTPGGIGVMLTSRYTLDSISADGREAIGAHADFLGAVRLPSSAHNQEAGTRVVTDILVLRGREPGHDPNHADGFLAAPDRVDGVRMSSYFGEYPEHVLGGVTTRSGRFSTPELEITGSLDEALESLPTALGQITEGRFSKPTAPAPAAHTMEQRVQPPAAIPGSFRLTDVHPEVFDVQEGWIPATKQVPEVTRLIKIRDALDATLAADQSGQDATGPRTALQAAYDDYRSRHGALTRSTTNPKTGRTTRPRQGGFRADPRWPAVSALETIDNGTGEIVPAQIITAPVPVTAEAPSHATTDTDALMIALGHTQRVDLDFIGQLRNEPGTNVMERLEATGEVFADPGTGVWMTRSDFLSGPVRERHREVSALDKTDSRRAPYLESLEEVIPAPATADDLWDTMGGSWVPIDLTNQFVQERIGGYDRHDRASMCEITYDTEGGWNVLKRRGAVTARWETDRVDAHKLVEAALNGTSVTVRPGYCSRVEG